MGSWKAILLRMSTTCDTGIACQRDQRVGFVAGQRDRLLLDDEVYRLVHRRFSWPRRGPCSNPTEMKLFGVSMRGHSSFMSLWTMGVEDDSLKVVLHRREVDPPSPCWQRESPFHTSAPRGRPQEDGRALGDLVDVHVRAVSSMAKGAPSALGVVDRRTDRPAARPDWPHRQSPREGTRSRAHAGLEDDFWSSCRFCNSERSLRGTLRRRRPTVGNSLPGRRSWCPPPWDNSLDRIFSTSPGCGSRSRSIGPVDRMGAAARVGLAQGDDVVDGLAGSAPCRGRA